MSNSRTRKIIISNFELMASVGVYEIEKKNKQKIIINIEILLTNESEPLKDNLHETQDYSQFRQIVHNIIKNKHFQLLEILSNEIHKKIIKNQFVVGAKVNITKPDIFSDCEVTYELSNI